MSLDDIVSILKEAESKGFSQLERHEVSWRYYEAKIEYKRLTRQPKYNGHNEVEIDNYYSNMRSHCAVKARGYMSRHIDKIQFKGALTPERLRNGGAL